MTSLETVAFDIETTGFEIDDQLTVVGFDLDLGSRVFLNLCGRGEPTELEYRLNDTLSTPARLSTHDTEAALLDAVITFVTSSLSQREVKLVAYNGDTWSGGFDLPFLRTRLSRHGLDWPFADLPYIDAMDVFKTRFNTSGNTLPDVYEDLIGDGLGTLDPFDDSSEAVEAWENGAFEPLVLHNIADIRRTRALMQLAERYCSKSDFSMKSLDPIT